MSLSYAPKAVAAPRRLDLSDPALEKSARRTAPAPDIPLALVRRALDRGARRTLTRRKVSLLEGLPAALLPCTKASVTSAHLDLFQLFNVILRQSPTDRSAH